MTINNLILDKKGVVRFSISKDEYTNLTIFFDLIRTEHFFADDLYFTKASVKINIKHLNTISNTILNNIDKTNTILFMKSNEQGKTCLKTFFQSIFRIKFKIDYWLKCIELRLI